MTTLALLTPLWARPRIERLVLEYYSALTAPYDAELFACFSEETPHEILEHASKCGWRLLACPTKPLGEKLNTATRLLSRASCARSVLFFGSDDLIHPDVLDRLYALARAGETRAVGVESAFFLDTVTWRACCFDHKHKTRPCGAGRLVRRDVLEQLNWILRDGMRTRNIDGSLDQRLRALGVDWTLLPRSTCTPVLDIKTGLNISSFEHMLACGARLIPPEPLLVRFPDRWQNAIRLLKGASDG